MERDGIAILFTALLLVTIVVIGCFALEWVYSDDDAITDFSAQSR